MLHSRLPAIAALLDDRIDAAIRAGAERVEQAAKQRVPVATGDLRDAIHTEATAGEGVYVIAGDTKAFYGHLVEFGTNNTPPRPFLIPAVEESRNEIVQNVKTAIRTVT